MYDTFIEAIQGKNLPAAIEELNAMTPEPMNTMLEKQSWQEATDVWKKRKSMVVQEVPPTIPGTVPCIAIKPWKIWLTK